jgi:hypothetical protein
VNESQSMEMMFSKRSAQARVSGDEALGIEGGGCDGRVRQEKKAGEGGLSDDDAPGFAVCFAVEQGNDFG